MSAFWAPTQKKLFFDIIFLIQMACAIIVCGSQFFHFFHSTTGQSLSVLYLIEGFGILHLLLAIGAYRAQPSRTAAQLIIIFATWLLLTAADIGALLWSESYQWDDYDTQICLITCIGLCAIALFMKLFHIPLHDPRPKALLAIFLKSLPQWIMSVKIMEVGGAGIPAAAIIGSNLSILLRIGLIVFSIYQEGWEENRKWLLLSETANELSFFTLTLAWFFY